MITKCQNIELRERLSKFRKPLMGIAILWIFMLHSGKTGNPVWDTIRSNNLIGGWAGVDIFFFLSAIGLCYSLNNNSRLIEFYKRRSIRILPTWLFVLLLVHIAGVACNHFLPDLPFHVPDTIIKCFTWYTGIGFWISSFVPGEGWFYEWYIPSLLVFYIFTPYLYKKSNAVLLVLFMLFLAMGYVLSQYGILTNIHFFYHRIPIFIMGILCYRVINRSNSAFCLLIGVCLLLGIATLLIKATPVIFPKEYVALFLCPPFLIVISYLIDFKYIKTVLSFLGGISLELYLIHLYRRPHYIVSFFFDNKYVVIIVTLLICIVGAYVLQCLVNSFVKKVNQARINVARKKAN